MSAANAVLICALLTGCPAQTLETERKADCCEVTDAGCEWMPIRYEAHRFAGPLATDEDACESLGLELHREAP